MLVTINSITTTTTMVRVVSSPEEARFIQGFWKHPCFAWLRGDLPLCGIC